METNQDFKSYGQCRCCLTKGNHLDLTKEYINDGIREVYSDIFVDCFNLFLCTDVRMTTLICTSCVTHLRNALQFKTKVLDSEKSLLDTFNSENGKLTVYLNNNVAPCELKCEQDVKEETCDSNINVYDDYEPECKDEDDLLYLRERHLLNRFPSSRLQMLPTKSNIRKLCAGYFRELDRLRGQTITGKMLKRLLEATSDTIDVPADKIKITRTAEKNKKTQPTEKNEKTSSSEKKGHISNITTLLTYSNLTAFKTKYKNGFPCFYCSARVENLQLLRTHQKSHKKENLTAFVKMKYRPGRPDCLVVYAEVTDLKCSICDQSISSLQDLKSHLINVHKKTMHLQYTDRVIPFKISDNGYQCQICFFFFETFGTIEKHMNTHFRNFVCEECGAGFISKNRLKVHTYNLHRGIGEFPCESCGKSFATRHKLRIHFTLLHKLVKKIKCPKCPARFADYFVCQKHLVDLHGVTPITYKCNVCERAFTRRFHLSQHIKKDHLGEKDLSCKLCSYSCFSNTELKVHMTQQHGERLFECPVCEKCYARQRSLKQHLNMHR